MDTSDNGAITPEGVIEPAAVHVCHMFPLGAPEGMDEHIKCINRPEVIDGKDPIRNRCDYPVAVTLEWDNEGMVVMFQPKILSPDETIHVAEDECLLWVQESRPIPRVFLFDDVHLGPEDEVVIDSHADFLSLEPERAIVIEGNCCNKECDEAAVDVGIRTVLRRLLAGGADAGQILLFNGHEKRIEEGCSDSVRRIEIQYGYTPASSQ